MIRTARTGFVARESTIYTHSGEARVYKSEVYLDLSF